MLLVVGFLRCAFARRRGGRTAIAVTAAFALLFFGEAAVAATGFIIAAAVLIRSHDIVSIDCYHASVADKKNLCDSASRYDIS